MVNELVIPDEYTSSEERKMYEDKILKDNSGSGTIYTGSYYTLDYQPAREDSRSLKCGGILLVTRRTSDKYSHDFYKVTVPFKEDAPDFLMKLFNPERANHVRLPFKDRLKYHVDTCVKLIKDKEAHINAVAASAEKITMCQRKIDKTMSEFKVEE
jgi:hypothetical protein